MARKITKKEIEKPDSFQAALKKVTAYISANKSKIYLASAIVVCIAIISAGWYLYRMNYEDKAQRIYVIANIAGMKAARQGGGPDQNNVQMYNDVITQYPGSKAAMMSYYQMGNLYYTLGDVDASIKAYVEFLKDVPDESDLRILAYNGIGYCYEKKADFPHALESFEKAANSKKGVGFEGMTYRNIARTYEEMNNKEKALEYYQKALTSTSDPSMELLLKKIMASIN
ncbi:MAG: tetratricopeptide repeat protein [Syntrophales bacterium]|jgi:tetratricopeptide (TPR) repeat protein